VSRGRRPVAACADDAREGRARRRSRSGGFGARRLDGRAAGGWKPSAMRSSPSRAGGGAARPGRGRPRRVSSGWRRTAGRRPPRPRQPADLEPELRARALPGAVRVRDVVGADAAELADFLASRPWRLAVQLGGPRRAGPGAATGQARARRWMAQEESVVSVAASSITRSRRRCSSRRSPRGGCTRPPQAHGVMFPSGGPPVLVISATSSRRPYDRRSTPSQLLCGRPPRLRP